MSEAKRDKTNGRSFGRIAALGTMGAALAVSALMLMSPIASATVISKPYYGLGSGTSVSVQKYGCSTAKTIKAPTFGKRAGVFKSAGMAKSPNCAASPIANEGFWSASLELVGNVHFATAGSHLITIAWKFIYSENWSMTPYSSCALQYAASYSTCSVSAEDSIFSFTEIWDQSNNTWGSYGFGFAQGSFIDIYNYSTVQNYSQNYCYAPSTCVHYGGNYSAGSPSGSITTSMFANSTLNLTGANAVNAGDKYQLQIYLYAEAFSTAYTQSAKGTGKVSSAAAIDMASANRGGYLQSITIA